MTFGCSVSLYLKPPAKAEEEVVTEKSSPLERVTFGTLLRSYLVYSICSIPMVVDHAPTILASMTSIPGLKQITELIVRHTFFAQVCIIEYNYMSSICSPHLSQFVGGDTAVDTIPIIRRLEKENIGTMLVYSAEVDEDKFEATYRSTPHQSYPAHKRIVDEMIRCIDVAAQCNESRSGTRPGNMQKANTWVAIKLVSNYKSQARVSLSCPRLL